MNAFVPTSNNNSKITGLLEKHPVILQLLRFVAIGFLNTGMAFIVYNLVSKFLGVVQGTNLGLISGLGFIFATIQSYFWNRNWAFGHQQLSLTQNLARLVLVGAAGVGAVLLVVAGSKYTALPVYYFVLLVIFIVAQLFLWVGFGFNHTGVRERNPYFTFFMVSLVGFFINVLIVAKFSEAVHLTLNPDLNKNIAQVAATCVSLIWNFIGYKIFVFKK